jgi:hypothetical protein
MSNLSNEDISAWAVERRDKEATAKAVGNLGTKLAVAAAATLFWWAMTGLFLGLVVYTYGKSLYAELHFRSANGVVLSREVVRHAGDIASKDDRDTYSVNIQYRYYVDGKAYVSDRYAYGISGPGLVHSAEMAKRAYPPPGAEVTVLYDPDDPAEAVLSTAIGEGVYLFAILIQPFLLAGLLLIGGIVALPWTHWQRARFLTRGPSLPWTIPTWGTARQDADAIRIRKAYSLSAAIAHFMVGYSVVCFAALPAGHVFGGFNGPLLTVIGRTVAVAAGVGLLAAGRLLFVRGGTIWIDPIGRRLGVRSQLRDEDVSFDEIKSWRLWQVHYPPGVSVDGQTVRYLLLEVVVSDGRTIPIHAFKPGAADGQGTVIARKTQQGLASLTTGEVLANIISSDAKGAAATPGANNPAGPMVTAGGASRGQDYSDLA